MWRLFPALERANNCRQSLLAKIFIFFVVLIYFLLKPQVKKGMDEDFYDTLRAQVFSFTIASHYICKRWGGILHLTQVSNWILNYLESAF